MKPVLPSSWFDISFFLNRLSLFVSLPYFPLCCIVQVPVDTGNAAQGGRSLWRMVGLDPTNIHVDAHLSNLYDYDSPSVHTRAPLRGSITGRTLVYGIQGAPLREGFNDLSHFGVGNRHRGGLISLPLVYTDLHQMVYPPSIPIHKFCHVVNCLLSLEL